MRYSIEEREWNDFQRAMGKLNIEIASLITRYETAEARATKAEAEVVALRASISERDAARIASLEAQVQAQGAGK